MRRMKWIVMVLAAGMLLVSCGKLKEDDAVRDAVIEKYEKACAAGDVVNAMAIIDRLDRSELTPEQSVRIIKASNMGSQMASDAFRGVANSMPYNYWDIVLNRLEELNDEYAEVLVQKANGKNVKTKMHKLEEKIEALIDKLDDAKLTKVQTNRFKKLKDWYDKNED